MKKQNEKTEAVKIRIDSEDIALVEQIAAKEFRSFSYQVRLAVHEWVETKLTTDLENRRNQTPIKNRSVR